MGSADYVPFYRTPSALHNDVCVVTVVIVLCDSSQFESPEIGPNLTEHIAFICPRDDCRHRPEYFFLGAEGIVEVASAFAGSVC
jgi:hypothetical protein